MTTRERVKVDCTVTVHITVTILKPPVTLMYIYK